MPATLFDPALPMDATRTVDVYETLRDRGPACAPRGMDRHRSVLDILDRFDALLLDGFGVLNVGSGAVPGAGGLLDRAAETGVAVLVLTNGASKPAAFAGGRYRDLGFRIDDAQVVSSRDAALHGMAGTPGPIGVVGGLVQMPEDRDRFVLLDTASPERWRGMGGIAFLGSIGWTTDWQDCLDGAMAAGVPVHVANPDVAAPSEDGFTMEPGFWMASALRDHPGAEVRWYGKPHGPVFDLAMARLEALTGRDGWERGRVAMVGDTLHTDILGANAAGMRSVLVTGHGLFRGGGAEEAIERTGIQPDYIVATV